MPTQHISIDAGRLHPVSPQGKETRCAVIRAALKHFHRHGFLDARVDQIASDAGVGYGTFYKYFRGKRDLVRAILTEVYDDIGARRLALLRDAPRPLHERAYPDLLVILRSFYEHRDTLRVLDIAFGADTNLAGYLNQLEQELLTASTEIIQSLAGESPKFDPRVAALAINAAIDETARRWIRSGDLTGDPEQDEPRLRELARALTAMCVSIIAPEELQRALTVADRVDRQRSLAG